MTDDTSTEQRLFFVAVTLSHEDDPTDIHISHSFATCSNADTALGYAVRVAKEDRTDYVISDFFIGDLTEDAIEFVHDRVAV